LVCFTLVNLPGLQDLEGLTVLPAKKTKNREKSPSDVK
jgi:hypothetical protein